MSVHFFILFLKCCAALEAMFTMLIVQLEWVQTWLAVAEVLLQAESDISPLGLLLLLLPELTCSCRNAFLQT